MTKRQRIRFAADAFADGASPFWGAGTPPAADDRAGIVDAIETIFDQLPPLDAAAADGE